jgi:uncharacterized protein
MIFINHQTTDDLISDVLSKKHHINHSVHGLDHWQRVERNGLYLSEREGGNSKIISLFALFHDSQRINDYSDPEHGSRGASLAEEFYQAGKLDVSSDELELLLYACRHHTDVIHHEDSTVQCCFDGDRLDLTRVGMMPDPEMLNTDTAKKLAVDMEHADLKSLMNRMSV